MAMTINSYCTGQNGSAKAFATEMTQNGVVDRSVLRLEISDMNISSLWMIRRQYC